MTVSDQTGRALRDRGAVIPPDIYDASVNALRFLSVDAVNKAASGHPGTPLDVAPVIYRLFTQHLRHDPTVPSWPDRDRFVLSGGHASMVLYGALHLCGYDLSLEGPPVVPAVGSRWVRGSPMLSAWRSPSRFSLPGSMWTVTSSSTIAPGRSAGTAT